MHQWNRELILITKDEYQNVPDGTTLTCIDGKTAIKGKDYIDMDTRFGLIAYGFKCQHHKLFISFGIIGISNE